MPVLALGELRGDACVTVLVPSPCSPSTSHLCQHPWLTCLLNPLCAWVFWGIGK